MYPGIALSILIGTLLIIVIALPILCRKLGSVAQPDI